MSMSCGERGVGPWRTSDKGTQGWGRAKMVGNIDEILGEGRDEDRDRAKETEEKRHYLFIRSTNT